MCNPALNSKEVKSHSLLAHTKCEIQCLLDVNFSESRVKLLEIAVRWSSKKSAGTCFAQHTSQNLLLIDTQKF